MVAWTKLGRRAGEAPDPNLAGCARHRKPHPPHHFKRAYNITRHGLGHTKTIRHGTVKCLRTRSEKFFLTLLWLEKILESRKPFFGRCVYVFHLWIFFGGRNIQGGHFQRRNNSSAYEKNGSPKIDLLRHLRSDKAVALTISSRIFHECMNACVARKLEYSQNTRLAPRMGFQDTCSKTRSKSITRRSRTHQ